jgi:hypothetical protein
MQLVGQFRGEIRVFGKNRVVRDLLAPRTLTQEFEDDLAYSLHSVVRLMLVRRAGLHEIAWLLSKAAVTH